MRTSLLALLAGSLLGACGDNTGIEADARRADANRSRDGSLEEVDARVTDAFVPNDGVIIDGSLTDAAATDAPPAATAPGLAGDLVITEIMANPSQVTDQNGEWFEVHNPTSSTFDLIGMVMKDDTSDSYVIPSSVIIGPGGYAIIARNGNTGTNGGVVADHVWANLEFFIANTSDEIELRMNGTLIDRVAYDINSGYPNTDDGGSPGRSMNLDSTMLTDVANDSAGAWCVSTTALGADFGTPGAANIQCSL